jgi:hypothetical protein
MMSGLQLDDNVLICDHCGNNIDDGAVLIPLITGYNKSLDNTQKISLNLDFVCLNCFKHKVEDAEIDAEVKAELEKLAM